jgi:hypothetical protein
VVEEMFQFKLCYLNSKVFFTSGPDLGVKNQPPPFLGGLPSTMENLKLRSILEKKRKFSILARLSPRHRLAGQTSFYIKNLRHTSFTRIQGRHAVITTRAQKL